MNQRLSQQLISFGTAVLIVLHSLTPAIVPWSRVGRVQAQETVEEAQVVQNEVTPTPSEQIESQPSSTPTPVMTVTPTDEPTPTETPAQEADPQRANELPKESGPNEKAPTTPATVETETTEQGELSVAITQNVKADSLDLGSIDTSSAQLSTDKGDYAPTDTVVITGTLLTPNQDYTLFISSSDPPAVTYNTQVTTDSQGIFIARYQLDGNYRQNYKIEVKNSAGNVIASTTFTDAAPTLTITRSGGGGGTVTSNDGFINCVVADGSTFGTCSHTYGGDNPVVILTAIPDASSSFDGWTGGTCAGTGTCTPSGLTENNEVTVEAIFNALPEDITPPVSEFTSPAEGSFWNTPIVISGSSTDIPNRTVDYVTLYYWDDNEGDWVEITELGNDGADPFDWYYEWEPEDEGVYDILVEATDTAENTEESPQVNNVYYDVTNPTSEINYPEEEVSYTYNMWEEEIFGTAQDENSGVYTVYLSIQRDSDGYYWDGEEGDWVTGDLEPEYLNETDFSSDSGNWFYEFEFIEPEGEDEGYTARSHAEDNAGNLEDTNVVHFYFAGEEEEDTIPPVSQISSPEEGFTTNLPIEISGSSSDESLDTVHYVQLFYRESVGEEEEENEWTEIDTDDEEEGNQPLQNTEGDEPFDWSFFWTPPNDGTFDIKAEATDTAGNTESSPEVHDITYDTTPPTTPTADPVAGDYTTDQSVTLASSDDLSGVASIFYTTDGSEPSDTNGTLYGDAIPIGVDTTLKAIAYDNAGNASNVLTAQYGIAPVISSEVATTVTTTSTTITWTTDDLATSRVVYDTLPHAELGAAPNYGYASSTVESDTSPKVTSHSVVISGLTSGTTYYFRTVSHGSPESVGGEKSFATTSPSSSGGDGGTGGSSSSTGTTASAPVCNDTKPGSAPNLTSAVSGVNSVTLLWSQAASPVTYYLVTYGTVSGAQTYGNPNVGGAGTSSYTVNNLSGGTTYYFRVRAGNGCMPGDYSNELSASPRGELITGVATGFTPGVLGASTDEKNADIQVTPTPEKEAVTADTVGEKTKVGKRNGWLLGLLLGGIGAFSIFFFVRRRREDNS